MNYKVYGYTSWIMAIGTVFAMFLAPASVVIFGVVASLGMACYAEYGRVKS